MFNNDLKTVLITGASGGIGRELSILFAKNNWNVLCHYKSNLKFINEIKNIFQNRNNSCKFIKSDFSDSKQINNFISYVEKFDIDSLINNAGISIEDDLNLEKIINLFMINTFSAMFITNAIFLRMKEKEFGRIVNISSIGVKYGSSISSLPYGCSKLALEGITKTFAREGAEYNILVNTVRPGVVDTKFHNNFSKDMEKRTNLIPIKKMIDIKEVVYMIYYLGSEKNNFITNETIAVAGGE